MNSERIEEMVLFNGLVLPPDAKTRALVRKRIQENLYLWRVYLKKWKLYKKDSVLISLHKFFDDIDLSKLHKVLLDNPFYYGSLVEWYPWEVAPTASVRDLSPNELRTWFKTGCISDAQETFSNFYGSIEQWVKLGLDAEDVVTIHNSVSDLIRERFSDTKDFNMANEVNALAKTGLVISVPNIVRWYGTSPEDILWLIDNELTSDACIYAVQFFERSRITDFEEISELVPDVSFREIRKFLEEGVTLYHAQQFESHGALIAVISLTTNWRPWTLWFSHNPRWEKYFDYLLCLASSGFDFNDLETMRKLPPNDFPPTVLRKWLDAGLSVHEAFLWRSSGLDPEVAIKRHINGIRPSGTRSI